MDYKEKFRTFMDEEDYEGALEYLERFEVNKYEDAFYYANMGWLYNHFKDYELSKYYLTKGLVLFPKDAWMYAQLGYAYNHIGNMINGINMLKKAISLGYEESWVFGELGWAYRELNDNKQAISYIEDALMDEPENIWLLEIAGSIYMDLEQYDIAYDYIYHRYQLFPDAYGCELMGRYFYALNDYNNCIEYLDNINYEERCMNVLYLLGDSYFQLNKYEDALENFLRSFKLGKDDTQLHMSLGECYLKLHNTEQSNSHYERALEYFSKARHHEGDQEWIVQEMVLLYEVLKKYAEEIKFIETLSEQIFNTDWMQYHLARAYCRENDFFQAIEICKNTLDKNDKDAEFLNMLGYSFGRIEEHEKAIQTLRHSLNYCHDQSWVYREMGWNYTCIKEYALAIDCFLEAIKIKGSDSYCQSMIGWSYVQMENYEKGIRYLKLALDYEPYNAWICSTLAFALELSNKKDEAIFYYQTALKINNKEEWVKKHLIKLKEEQKNEK